MSHIKRDFHMHTDLSTCAAREAKLPAMVAAARAAGVEHIGISDHFHELHRDFAEMARINRQLVEQEKSRDSSLNLYLGCEAQMDSPDRCTIDAALASQFDYVMCSCNHYHLRQVENPEDRSPAGYARHYLRMVEGAIDTGFVDVIVHPFLHDKIANVDQLAVLEAYDRAELDRILKKAADAAVAFELNPGHASKATAWFRDLYGRLRSFGGKISLGSDSHSPQALGYKRNGEGSFTWEDLVRDFGLEQKDLYLPGAKVGASA